MSERPGRYQRSFPGMVGALVVLLLVIAAFVIFRDVNRDDPGNPVKAVDYLGPAEYARQRAEFPLLAPRKLPDGWIATSARFEDGEDQSWHLGVLTDEERYVGLEQSADSANEMVEEHVDEDAIQGEDVQVFDDMWQSWTDEGGDLALVREAPEGTTLLVGRVDEETLKELIATLR